MKSPNGLTEHLMSFNGMQRYYRSVVISVLKDHLGSNNIDVLDCGLRKIRIITDITKSTGISLNHSLLHQYYTSDCLQENRKVLIYTIQCFLAITGIYSITISTNGTLYHIITSWWEHASWTPIKIISIRKKSNISFSFFKKKEVSSFFH